MPDGAQAWKMIKTPGSQNNRTAQACDRCRSKKIKCDGKRPNCTSCESVGFDCKITDKLTRRAFPRGYTESLEERVRLLEQEKKKLTDLLDLKDEQMEMMSKVEDFHEFNRDPVRQSSVASSTTSNSSSSSSSSGDQHPPPGLTSSSEDDDEYIPLPQVLRLNENRSYTGASSGVILGQVLQRKFAVRAPSAVTPVLRVFDDARGMYNNVVPNVNMKTDLPTPSSISSPSEMKRSPSGSSLASSTGISPYSYAALNVGSRLTCDQLVTTYFQEWHSMYSIVDQYAFLDEYQKYVEGGETDELFAVQLVLIMALASLASRAKISSGEMKRLDIEWRTLFSPELQQRPGVRTAQALCLAQLYCLHTQDIAGIYHYRTQVLGIVLRSALYKDPLSLRDVEGHPLSFYEQEMRRRTYWNVFVLDTFGAAVLGSPRVLNCSYPSCEMPSNVDDDELRDELSARNSMTTSCAHAVMTFSQILASLVDTIYSSSTTRLTSKLIIKFEDQLESWRRDLSSNLKFEFADGVPKATLAPVHQKSPILLMYFNYARILLHMPSVAAAAQEGEAFVPAVLRNGVGSSVTAMQSAKTFIQVFNYLQKRSVQSTMCLNPSRMILRIGTIVLYSAVDYSRGGALLQDARVLMSSAQEYIYSQMQCGKPGCVNSETYHFFEQACDIVLGSTSEVTPVTASRKPRRSVNPSAKRQPRTIPSNLRNPTPPLSDGDELALDLLTRSVISSSVNMSAMPPVTSSNDVLQTIAIESLLYPDVKPEKIDSGVDDYLDFWSSTDYTAMYDRPLYEI